MAKKQSQIKFWALVDQIIRRSDVILEILDSRFPTQTRNEELESRIKKYGRKHIFVLNKADMVPKKTLFPYYDQLKEISPTVMMSCQARYGKLKLSKTIKTITHVRPMKVGVIGYPNVGKSSVINYLKGKKSARTSPVAGYTKGQQWLKMSKEIMLIDTPGVIPFNERSRINLIIKSAMTSIKDPETAAADLLEVLAKEYKEALESYYKIKVSKNGYETLERIAQSKNIVKKNNQLDLQKAGSLIINEWQKNKIKIYK